jgi:hypothetical protein
LFLVRIANRRSSGLGPVPDKVVSVVMMGR